MNESRISVLMPLKSYHPEFLNKAIQSVVNQTCPYWHLLIIVEKRDLKTFREILESELNDSRIKMIVNEGRKLAGALNTGMRQAKTDFAAILLADDMWSLKAIQVLNIYIVKYPNIDFFHSSRVKIDENDNPISSVYYSKEKFSIDDFKMSSQVKHLLCWRKDKALAFGGLDESLNNVGSDDYDFPWTMAEKGAAFKAVKECLYYYRDHRECYRLTTHLPLSVHIRELRRIFEKHGVDSLSIKEKIARAEGTYLRQCLYRSPRDKRIKEKLGYDARGGWREKYR
ncbi:MAG: glycosyltransferase [Thermodesulfobacteriota bacterium]